MEMPYWIKSLAQIVSGRQLRPSASSVAAPDAPLHEPAVASAAGAVNAVGGRSASVYIGAADVWQPLAGSVRRCVLRRAWAIGPRQVDAERGEWRLTEQGGREGFP